MKNAVCMGPANARIMRFAATVVAPALLMVGGGHANAADPTHPTVVELFQSQGCSSCPPANANFLAVASRADILALSWQVTYWDYLGWKDSFARPEFTARQWDYARALHRSEVATPQIIINGRATAVGSVPSEIDALIRRNDRGSGGPMIRLTSTTANVDGAETNAWVMLVRYDPRLVQVPVQRGENGGRTLPHRNVVREVKVLGASVSGSRTFDLPPNNRHDLKTAILVQQGRAGPILAAAHD
jgi:hypothetical protein